MEQKREQVLSKQLLRSGTSIGANASEAQYAQTKADFYAKMAISLKEANESMYWLRLLQESGYLSNEEFQPLYEECRELVRMLIATQKTRNNEKSEKETQSKVTASSLNMEDVEYDLD